MRTRWVKSLSLIHPSWICICIDPEDYTAKLEADLIGKGFHPTPDDEHCYTLKAEKSWNSLWPEFSALLQDHGAHAKARIGVINGENLPATKEIEFHYKSATATDEIAECMWLVEALADKRISCHFQPVVDRRQKIFGHESLVRATSPEGDMINGGAIFKASKTLRIEHLIDRALHEMAIQTYANSNMDGFLFINFIPGFIQRPEFYLEGLSSAVIENNVNPRHIVLDCTKSERPRDLQHIKSIFDYCRNRGYLISLDDIESVDSARRFLREMRPDFVKLDMRLVRKAGEPDSLDIIKRILQLAKNAGASVIAEGVETQEIHSILLDAGVDLFQGYLFSPPAIAQLQEKSTSSVRSTKSAAPTRKAATRKS